MKVFPEVRVLAEGHSFLEGPRWRSDRLYVSDFFTHRILCFDEQGAMQVVADVPGRPSGLGFTPDGALLAVSMQDRRLLRVEADGLTEVADLSSHTPYLANEMFVDEKGRAYVGNFGFDTDSGAEMETTSLFLVNPDGSVTIAAKDLLFPNGTLKSPDGERMIVAETFAARISQFDIAPDGTLANRRIWADFSTATHTTLAGSVASGDLLPDGLAMDAEGAIWAADAGGRGPVRVIEGGEQAGYVDTGDMTVYAVALGGRNGRTLFMCAAPPILDFDPTVERKACLLTCEVDVPAA
jgi:sugar lactone lactonase YvrE